MKLQKQYGENLVPFAGKLLDLECPVHGVNPYTWEKYGKRYRCRGCNTDAILARKLRLKRTLVEERGGGCEVCGYNTSLRALHFHHIDPSNKDFEIGNLTSKSEKLVREEVAKCKLVCSNCHAEEEDEIWTRSQAGRRSLYTRETVGSNPTGSTSSNG